ncbi:MAG: wax ester/triacylglycerol synthase domain-containing protein [Amnibacterium sp.]
MTARRVPRAPSPRGPVDRVSAEDLMSLAADRGSTPMQVGAVLRFPPGGRTEDLPALLRDRVTRVPRLRQRLVPVPFGAGRPIWIDDPGFALARHLEVVRVPNLDETLMALAAALLVRPLPRDRPLWAARLVRDDHDRSALVLVLHHVLADGSAALALLAALADGADAVPDPAFPRARPPLRRLVSDAAAGRLRSLREVPARLGRLGRAVTLLGPAVGRGAEPTSLTRPTGLRRRLLPVTVELGGVVGVAHGSGATVNDVVLTAIAGAVGELLSSRGEHLRELVVSIPFAVPAHGAMGNHSAVLPVRLPTGLGPLERLHAVTRATAAAKRAERGTSNAILGPAFRLLARAGLFHRYIDRQRTIHTVVTNLRGPAEPLAISGHPIAAIVPMSATTGNLTVSFAILSYAGALTVTIVADADLVPDADLLARLLGRQLDAVLREAVPRGSWAGNDKTPGSARGFCSWAILGSNQ